MIVGLSDRYATFSCIQFASFIGDAGSIETKRCLKRGTRTSFESCCLQLLHSITGLYSNLNPWQADRESGTWGGGGVGGREEE